MDLTPLERRITRLERLIKPPLWVDWTPTVDQNGAVAATVTYARYARFGKIAVVQFHLAVTAAGSAGSAIIVGGVPDAITPAQTGSRAVAGAGIIEDDGTTHYTASIVFQTASTLSFKGYNAGDIGSSPSFALASGDEISGVCAYEIAKDF